MAHPFLKIFENALRKSTPTENVVLKEAKRLKEKGYSVREIHAVLSQLRRSLISDQDTAIVGEAVEEFAQYL